MSLIYDYDIYQELLNKEALDVIVREAKKIKCIMVLEVARLGLAVVKEVVGLCSPPCGVSCNRACYWC